MAGVEWRPIPGTNYAASSEGDIRRETPGPGTRPGRVLKPWTAGGRDGKSYLYVSLYKAGKRKKCLVHCLVARAFHGPRPGRLAVCDHGDGETFNNRPTNLEWVNRPENMRRWLDGQRPPPEPDSADAHLPAWAVSA